MSEDLAEQLRLLRDVTGRSLRELARDTHTSSSSLSRYFSGQAVPPWQAVVALCRVAGRDPRPLRELWERARNGTRSEPAPAAAPVRNDLPHDVTAFTGRRDELATLLEAARTTRMVAIDGMGGVGKTALAVHAAHLLTPEFPGGQLYLDLHGFTPGREPVEPEEALRLLLAALGVAPGRIPGGAPERAALWRAELATRRAIVLLDNAADADHVRELLPGAGQSLIMITSRRRMVELDAVVPVSLDVLPETDAAELFARAAGGERDGDVAEVLRRCGNLPLAIRVAAARLRHRPSWTLDTLAERLHAGELAVSGVFEMSLRQLDPAQRRMFGLLGIVPGNDVDAHAAAAMAGIPLGNARSLLEDLVDAHLLQEPTAGRYRMHDLLRQTARAEGTEATEAIARLADYYLTGLLAADRAMAHETALMSITVMLPPADVPPMDDALGWLDAESDNIVATFWAAEELALDAQVVGLGQVAGVYFARRGGLEHMSRLVDAALPAAERLDDRRGRTWLHFVRGQVRQYGSRPAEAAREYEAARALMAEDGDVAGEVLVLGQLAELRMKDGDFPAAVELLRESTRLLPDGAGEYHLATQARIGHALVRLGEYREAHTIVSEVLDAAREAGDPLLERMCLDVLGPATLGLGDAETALELAEQAVTIGRATGHVLFEATSLSDVAVALRHLGRLAEALDRHAEALRIVEEAGERQFALQVLIPYAETCLAAGDRDGALAHYRTALEGATALGLRHLATVAGDALAGLERPGGVPSRPGTPSQHPPARV